MLRITTIPTTTTTTTTAAPIRTTHDDQIIRADGTIRPHHHGQFCIHKRYNGYKKDQTAYVWDNCDETNDKNLWSYEDNGNIKNKGGNYCLMVRKPKIGWLQSVKIGRCSSSDIRFEFDFDGGMIVPRSNKKLCLGWKRGHRGVLNSLTCYSNNWLG